jgi:hypothetical protein
MAGAGIFLRPGREFFMRGRDCIGAGRELTIPVGLVALMSWGLSSFEQDISDAIFAFTEHINGLC